MYDIKALYEAESVQHAVQLLQEHPEAQILAGGSDVLVQVREGRRSEPSVRSEATPATESHRLTRHLPSWHGMPLSS